MTEVYIDTGVIRDLYNSGSLDKLPTSGYSYKVTNYIYGELSTEMRDALDQVMEGRENFSLIDVSERFDLRDLDNPDNNFGVTIDSQGNFKQLGDASLRYLEQADGIISNGGVVWANDRGLSNWAVDVSAGGQGAYRTPFEHLNVLLAEGSLSETDYNGIKNSLDSRISGAYPQEFRGFALDQSQVNYWASYADNASSSGFSLTPGIINAAAIGTEVLRQAGFAGDLFGIALTAAQSSEMIAAGDTVGAEALWVGFFGDVAGGAAGAAAATLVAAGLIASTGIGGPAALGIIVVSALVGGYGGSQLGSYAAQSLHAFVVEKINNGEPILLDELAAVLEQDLKDAGVFGEVATRAALIGNTTDLMTTQNTLLELLGNHPELADDPGYLSRAALAIQAFGGSQAWTDFLAEIGNECFAAGTPVSLLSGDQKPIEQIAVGDIVTSYGEDGILVPGRVVRTFENEVSHLLDVHGLKVTPGHVTLCGEGRFAGRHVPIIDILLSDGALVRESGELIRMSTNKPVGELEDQMVEVSYAETSEDLHAGKLKSGQMRVGTLLFDKDGVAVSVLDCIRSQGLEFDAATGLVCADSSDAAPLNWFGPLPRPEDYILRRSRETLEDILTSGEWEGSPSELIAGRLKQTAERYH